MLENSLETPNEKDAKIKNLELKLNQAEEKIRKYELQVNNLSAQQKQLENDLTSKTQEANRIADDRNELEKQYELLLKQFIKLTEEAENKNIDVANYKSQLKDMQEILTKQNNDLNDLANNNKYLQNRNQDLDMQNFKKRNEIDELKGLIEAKEIYNKEKDETQKVECDKLKKKNDELEQKIELLQTGKNSDSLIDKIILDKEYKRTRLIIGISLAVVGLSLIVLPFIIPSVVGMDAIIFGAVFFVSAILSAPALFYENLSKEKLRNNGLGEGKDVQDGFFFKKVSGLVFGIGLILAAAACLAFPSLSVVLFSKAINDILYLVLAFIGAYLISRFYAIKQPEFKPPYDRNSIDDNVDLKERSDEINNSKLIQNNLGYNIPNNLYNDNKGQNCNYNMNSNGIDNPNLRNNNLNYNNAQNRYEHDINENYDNELPTREELYQGQGYNQNIDNN